MPGDPESFGRFPEKFRADHLLADRNDFDLGVGLTMTLTLAIILLRLELEDGDFLGFAELHNAGIDLRAIHIRSAEDGAVVITDAENLVENDVLTGFLFDLLDEKNFAVSDLVLLAAGFKDCVHCFHLIRILSHAVGGGTEVPSACSNLSWPTPRGNSYYNKPQNKCQEKDLPTLYSPVSS